MVQVSFSKVSPPAGCGVKSFPVGPDLLPLRAVPVFPGPVDKQVQVRGQAQVVAGVFHVAGVVHPGEVAARHLPALVVDPGDHLGYQDGEEGLFLAQAQDQFFVSSDQAFSPATLTSSCLIRSAMTLATYFRRSGAESALMLWVISLKKGVLKRAANVGSQPAIGP